jgi:hypothetical protein
MSTVPVLGGLSATITPSELTEKEVAGTPPKSTAVAPVNPLAIAPCTGPAVGGEAPASPPLWS